MHQYATLEDTLYFGFASNATSGSADDGATPLFDVRLGGAAASAAPVLSGTPTLLTHANYSPGCYEVAIAATAANGFAAGNTYLVFVTLTVDSQTPAAMVGSFTLAAVPANTTTIAAAAVATILTTSITEAYRANGAAPTIAQFISETLAHLGEAEISGTTKTINKLDHSTAAETFTLDSATAPTSITRAT